MDDEYAVEHVTSLDATGACEAVCVGARVSVLVASAGAPRQLHELDAAVGARRADLPAPSPAASEPRARRASIGPAPAARRASVGSRVVALVVSQHGARGDLDGIVARRRRTPPRGARRAPHRARRAQSRARPRSDRWHANGTVGTKLPGTADWVRSERSGTPFGGTPTQTCSADRLTHRAECTRGRPAIVHF